MCDCSNKDEDTPNTDLSEETAENTENGEETHHSKPFTDETKQEWLDKVKKNVALKNRQDEQQRDDTIGRAQKHINAQNK